MKKPVLSLLVAASVLAGCAAGIEPQLSPEPVKGFDLVDISHVNQERYHQDYASCVNIANQDLVDIKRSAANAVNSVADKASLGVLGGRPGKHADRVTVLKRCLSGRGYTVLR